MITKKIIYITGAAVCFISAAIFRAIALPFALAYEALEAMARTLDDSVDQILENIKSEK